MLDAPSLPELRTALEAYGEHASRRVHAEAVELRLAMEAAGDAALRYELESTDRPPEQMALVAKYNDRASLDLVDELMAKFAHEDSCNAELQLTVHWWMNQRDISSQLLQDGLMPQIEACKTRGACAPAVKSALVAMAAKGALIVICADTVLRTAPADIHRLRRLLKKFAKQASPEAVRLTYAACDVLEAEQAVRSALSDLSAVERVDFGSGQRQSDPKWRRALEKLNWLSRVREGGDRQAARETQLFKIEAAGHALYKALDHLTETEQLYRSRGAETYGPPTGSDRVTAAAASNESMAMATDRNNSDKDHSHGIVVWSRRVHRAARDAREEATETMKVVNATLTRGGLVTDTPRWSLSMAYSRLLPSPRRILPSQSRNAGQDIWDGARRCWLSFVSNERKLALIIDEWAALTGVGTRRSRELRHELNAVLDHLASMTSDERPAPIEKESEKPKLPIGWNEHFNLEYGLPYFVHEDGHTVWERPSEGQAVLGVDDGQLPEGWTEFMMHPDDGSDPIPYFVDVHGRTTWTRPTRMSLFMADLLREWLEVARRMRSAKEESKGSTGSFVMPPGWVANFDKSSHQWYYVSDEGEINWDTPTTDGRTEEVKEEERRVQAEEARAQQRERVRAEKAAQMLVESDELTAVLVEQIVWSEAKAICKVEHATWTANVKAKQKAAEEARKRAEAAAQLTADVEQVSSQLMRQVVDEIVAVITKDELEEYLRWHYNPELSVNGNLLDWMDFHSERRQYQCVDHSALAHDP